MSDGAWQTPPTTCREYLGAVGGYCTQLPAVTDLTGRGFCTRHASERADWIQKHCNARQIREGLA
jgi:hypothetical protein